MKFYMKMAVLMGKSPPIQKDGKLCVEGNVIVPLPMLLYGLPKFKKLTCLSYVE